MKKLLFLLIWIIFLTGCSSKITKSELMNEIEKTNFCEGIACEKGVVIKENLNGLLLDCYNNALEPLPNEITSAQVEEIRPELVRCIKTKIEFTPIVSKDIMIFVIMDRDNTDRFSNYKSNMNRLELNNSVAHCYKVALEKKPPVMTMNQFKAVELEVQKCMFDKFNQPK